MIQKDYNETTWWKKCVIYQIYPRSFYDTTGNGIGDLPGIIEQLNYLQDLGITAIWISPCFPSPMVDFGYDITNYIDIHPDFGTLEDMDNLIEKAHTKNIKVILDYVANHTSDEHPWFVESKKSKNNPKSDFYIWKDPQTDGSVPNNWLCVPGGSAWEWCEERQQYYYHSFLRCQPDVNWKNPELRKEMLNVLRFWLNRGIDGFRIDMISWLYKDDLWRDNPPNPDYNPEKDMNSRKLLRTYTTKQPGLFNYLELISKTVHEYKGKVIIGEGSYDSSFEEHIKYFGTDGDLVNLPAMFEFIIQPWNRNNIFNILKTYYSLVPPFGWPNFQLGNHDRSRVASRIGGREKAKAAAILLLTLKGTPFIYYGEEIGMMDVSIPKEKIQDITAKTEPKMYRDPYRTPMQWNKMKNAGYTNGEPWLPVSLDYNEYNVESELKDESSFLQLYKTLIKLRNTHDVFQVGEIELLDVKNNNCIGYNRTDGLKKEFGVFVNFSEEEQLLEIKNNFEVIISSYNDKIIKFKSGTLKLRKNEALVVKYS